MTVDRVSGDEGFSLFETLVALLLIALTAAVIAAAARTHDKAARASERREEAVFLAQALFEQYAGAPAVKAPFAASGSAGSNDWEVDIAPFDADFAAPDLAEVRVSVRWSGDENGAFELKSLRLIVP